VAKDNSTTIRRMGNPTPGFWLRDCGEIVPGVVEIENGGSSGPGSVARTTFDEERRNRHEEKVHETG
jgi:hypothetical protein